MKMMIPTYSKLIDIIKPLLKDEKIELISRPIVPIIYIESINDRAELINKIKELLDKNGVETSRDTNGSYSKTAQLAVNGVKRNAFMIVIKTPAYLNANYNSAITELMPLIILILDNKQKQNLNDVETYSRAYVYANNNKKILSRLYKGKLDKVWAFLAPANITNDKMEEALAIARCYKKNFQYQVENFKWTGFLNMGTNTSGYRDRTDVILGPKLRISLKSHAVSDDVFLHNTSLYQFINRLIPNLTYFNLNKFQIFEKLIKNLNTTPKLIRKALHIIVGNFRSNAENGYNYIVISDKTYAYVAKTDIINVWANAMNNPKYIFENIKIVNNSLIINTNKETFNIDYVLYENKNIIHSPLKFKLLLKCSNILR